MVSELRWHPNQENCFLWQALSISLTLFSLSLTLWRTHTALMHKPVPPPTTLLFLSFRNSNGLLRHKHKNTLCKKGVKRVTGFQKGKDVTIKMTKCMSRRKTRRLKSHGSLSRDNLTALLSFFLRRMGSLWRRSISELADAPGTECGTHGWLSTVNCEQADRQ